MADLSVFNGTLVAAVSATVQHGDAYAAGGFSASARAAAHSGAVVPVGMRSPGAIRPNRWVATAHGSCWSLGYSTDTDQQHRTTYRNRHR